MKVNIYTIYDKVSEECGPVFQAKNDVVAHRAFKHLILDTPNVDSNDYEIYCLGLFDNETRFFVPEVDYGRLVLKDLEENDVDIQ